MIRLASLFGLFGLMIATGLIAWSGYSQVLQALGTAGWGILWTSLFHLVPMTVSIWGWQALMPGKNPPSRRFFLYLLWLRASVNNLMPVARIGGEVLAVRVMVKQGIRKSAAIAATVVETTLSVIGEFLFTLTGISLFALHVSNRSVTLQLFIGLLIALPVIGGLLWMQKAGFFGLMLRLFRLLFRDRWQNLDIDARLIDRAVLATYRRRGRIAFCLATQVVGWALGSAEIWLALHFLGHTLALAKCVMIEALIQATGSAGFIVPGALGLQEAGFLLFGHMLGLTPEVAAALAVIRRCRDLLLYVPGLIAWQVQEGRWLSEGRRQASGIRSDGS